MDLRFVVVLDYVSHRYGVRPSALVGLGVEGLECVAAAFDIEVATASATERERVEREHVKRRRAEEIGAPKAEEIEEFFMSLPEGSVVRRQAEAIKKKAANG